MQHYLLQLFACVVCGHDMYQHISTRCTMMKDEAVSIIIYFLCICTCVSYAVEGLGFMLQLMCVLALNKLHKYNIGAKNINVIITFVAATKFNSYSS